MFMKQVYETLQSFTKKSYKIEQMDLKFMTLYRCFQNMSFICL